ncbi:MAG: beta family protein [Thermoleophilaceae bacterium]|nr:beta family protein [Thermoleophilaceae bacterium]
MANDHRRYVPILRAKQGEFAALGETEAAVKDRLTPLIELTPISYEPDDDGDVEVRVDPSFPQVVRRLEQHWGTDLPVFVDLGFVPSASYIAGGKHPVEFVAHEAREAGVQAVFVTDLHRDDPHQAAIRAGAQEDRRGVCVRLTAEDFDDLAATAAELEAVLTELAVDRADADLILDLGEIGQAGTLAATGLIRGLPNIADWRSVILAATAFPRVANFSANTVNTSPRTEWTVWRNVLAQADDLPRMPGFGDYTVVGVQTAYEQTAAFYRPSPNLRYTTADDYLVLKARHARHGHDQFNDLCRTMVGRGDFAGAAFSRADRYINRCAENSDGPGNAMTWLKVGINHHLATVAAQISSLP